MAKAKVGDIIITKFTRTWWKAGDLAVVVSADSCGDCVVDFSSMGNDIVYDGMLGHICYSDYDLANG